MQWPLNDTQALTIDLRLILDTTNNSQSIRRKLNLIQEFPSVILFSSTAMSVEKWASLYHTNTSGMKSDFPDNVHLLSFKPRDSNTNEVILRLNHLCEVSDHTDLSKPVRLNVNSHFANALQFNQATEKTLSLQQDHSQMRRQQWKSLNSTSYGEVEAGLPLKQDEVESSNEDAKAAFTVQLNPIQIKTFVAKIGK